VSIDIANESGVAVSEVALVAVARHVLDRLRIHPLAELSILLVGEDAMADLHQRWMGEPGPTDVLSFPMDELRPPHMGGGHGMAGGHEPEPVPGLLGDVVLCPQIAAKQAQTHGHSSQDEVELLCIHGILHLLGYDHAEPEEHATMFGLQDELMASSRGAAGDHGDHGDHGGGAGDGGTRDSGTRDGSVHDGGVHDGGVHDSPAAAGQPGGQTAEKTAGEPFREVPEGLEGPG
jgi:probable rRNA maturation factor